VLGHMLSWDLRAEWVMLQSSCSNKWLVGWAVLIRGPMWSLGVLLMRLVELIGGERSQAAWQAKQVVCCRDLEGSCRSRAVDRVDDYRWWLGPATRGSVCLRTYISKYRDRYTVTLHAVVHK
jgi:hypothetical protein